jgi:UDP-2,3-diacylglucosamine hydrolase
MRICVISDVHFKYTQDSTADQQNEKLILSFLREAAGKYDLMVLNGDIFDLWFDWKYTIIKQYFPLLHALANIRDNGCRIVYVSGNHDFWFNDFMHNYLQIEIHPAHFDFNADSKRILVTHGDLYTVNDLRYRIFRQLIRVSWLKKVFTLVHPDLSLSLGKMLSRSSRARKLSSVLKIKQGTGLENYARVQFEKGKYDIVIMGHSHKPLVKNYANGVYANSGDWIINHTYIEIIEGKLELIKYNLQGGSL